MAPDPGHACANAAAILPARGHTAQVCEEHGGSRTAYEYDLLIRRKAATCLERGTGDAKRFFAVLEWETLAEAKTKAMLQRSLVYRTLRWRLALAGP